MEILSQLLLVIASIFLLVSGLTDEELEKVKKMVDEELAKRKSEVVLAGPNTLVTKATTKQAPTTQATSPQPEVEEHINNNFVDNCFDMYGQQKCQVLIHELQMDCDKDRLPELCAKSCGFCGNHANPGICFLSKFGCCDDGVTSKKNGKGTNCPVCRDNMDICPKYVKDCNDVSSIAGPWMRKNCKYTCDICPQGIQPAKPVCQDDPEQVKYCHSWKEEGLCEFLPKMMSKNCAKTCDACA